MIALPKRGLSTETQRLLSDYQREVDLAGGYAERIAQAKRLFKSRNRQTNDVFKEVRKVLDSMCSGVRRCCYCEDSAADEVEHVRPKDFFPELVFVWQNYLYACGPCNGPKQNRYAALDATATFLEETVREKDKAPLPPPSGVAALIDPRTEDPLTFFDLDLVDTFWLLPRPTLGPAEWLRAEHTIEVLHLNDRDVLPASRKAAYKDYVAHLRAYAAFRDEGADSAELARRQSDITARQHPTVWREMQRQPHARQELKDLFARVPEALLW